MPKDNRYYVTFTVEFPNHPKIAILSDKAFRCLHEAISHARELQTDGVLKRRYAIARWGADTLHELCTNDDDNPSLVEIPEGWLIHDYAEHNDTKEAIQKRSEAAKRAGQIGGRRKAAKTAASDQLAFDQQLPGGPLADRQHVAKQPSSGPPSEPLAEPSGCLAAVAVTVPTAVPPTSDVANATSPVGGPRASARELSSDESSFLEVFDTDDTYDLATSPRNGARLSAPASGNASHIVKDYVPSRRISGADRSRIIIEVSATIAEHGAEFAIDCIKDWVATDKGREFYKCVVGNHVARRFHSENPSSRRHEVSTTDRKCLDYLGEDGFSWGKMSTTRELTS